VISQLQTRHAEARAQAQRATADLEEARWKLGISEGRVTDLLEAQGKARRLAEVRAGEAVTTHAHLTAEIDVLRVTSLP